MIFDLHHLYGINISAITVKMWLFCVFPSLLKRKMGQRSVPIFVNLKSNTMKNTLQRYDYFNIRANISANFFKYFIY